MKDILFLEDDKILAQSIMEELEHLYSIEWVAEGDDAIERSFDSRYNLYLFDVNVPGISGFELLEQLRLSGDTTPAIFLTSQNQLDDLERGFAVGADDYIKKPFDLHELLIRIKAKMPKNTKEYFSAHFAIEKSTRSIYCYNTIQKLPAKEFALVEYMLRHSEGFLAPEDIIGALYEHSSITIATFRTYIKNIKRHTRGCIEVENLKGVGYRFKLL